MMHERAFPTPAEADLVDALRQSGRLVISLVAVAGEVIVGHAAVSPVTLADSTLRGLGLAPVAVLPEFQRQGIATSLIFAALENCRRIDCDFVVVLGSPKLYGRCGFSAAWRWNLVDEYQGGDAFQAIELTAGALAAHGGLAKYAPEFAVFA
jgi:putative acetyltransferase